MVEVGTYSKIRTGDLVRHAHQGWLALVTGKTFCGSGVLASLIILDNGRRTRKQCDVLQLVSRNPDPSVAVSATSRVHN